MARPQVENSVRSLSRLHKAGSTARVLDLLRVWENAQHDNEPIEKPIFTHPILNKSFVIKHRLRRNETDIFEDGRATATKVLLPLDLSNLDAGGRYIFVGQPNYIDILSDATGIDISARQSDLKVMRALDSLPSFDPFLLREWLAKFGVFPDPRYFELSLSSVAQMEAFVFVEISQLVSMSLSGHTQNESITRLVKKLLSSNYDRDLDPLREVLRLSDEEFREGMFCWKGFLYYKWSAKTIEQDIPPLIQDIRSRQPERGIDAEGKAQLEASRRRIGRGMVETYNRLVETILNYDNAYKQMTSAQNPLAFKRFLLASPKQFLLLGETMGQLQHVLQFWRYRTRSSGTSPIAADEYIDILRDFEDSMSTKIN